MTEAELAKLRANVAAGRSNSERPAVVPPPVPAPAPAPKPRPKPKAPPEPAAPPQEPSEPEDEAPEPPAAWCASESPGGAVLNVGIDPGGEFLRVQLGALAPERAKEVAAYFAGMLAAWPELSLTANLTVNGTNIRAAGIPRSGGPEFVAAVLRILTNQ